ncbi:MAG: tape measure protein [Thermomicrobium sp.]|nr:tape measure protein [Thermomicrobium sp.]MDW8006655.1 tape measure protein [Thermomicrobium sp.]
MPDRQLRLVIKAENLASSEIQKATRDLEKLAQMPARVASEFLRVGSQLGMTVFGLQQLGNAVSGLGNALFSYNARMEQTSVAFSTLIGSAEQARTVLRDLHEFAARTPFEFPELAQSVRFMAAFGFEAGQLLPTLQAVGDAVSALGGGSFELQRVVLALGQMAAKGQVSAEEMLQLTEVGIPAWDILAEKVGVSTAQLQTMTERGLIPARQAIDMLVEGMGERFAGAMEAQSRTFTGLMSTLRDNVNMALGRIMEPAFEAAKDELEHLVAFLGSPEFEQWSAEMADGARELAQEIGTFLREHGPDLLRLAGSATQAALDLASAVARLANELEALDAALGGRGLEVLLGLYVANKATGGLGGSLVGGLVSGTAAGLMRGVIGGDAASTVGATGAAAAAGGAAIPIGALVAAGLALGAVQFVGGQWAAREIGIPQLAPLASTPGLASTPFIAAASVKKGADAIGFERMLEVADRLTEKLPGLNAAVHALGDALRGSADAAAVAADVTLHYGNSVQQLHLLEANLVDVIQQATPLQRLQAEYIADLAAATDALSLAQATLAQTYTILNDAQKAFSEQASEYQGNLKAIEQAVAAIQEKQAAGIPLSAQELELLQEKDELIARLTGGIRDATIEQGLYAAAQTELMLAQDEVNRLLADGKTGTEEYEAAVRRLEQAQQDYRDLLPDSVSLFQELNDTNRALARVLHDELVPALLDLITNLEALPKDPIAIQIQLATEVAERQLAELQAAIRSGAILPVSLVTGSVGPGAGPFQQGGIVPRQMLALVGEMGPELVVLPAGAHVIPAGETRAILNRLPFAGAFQHGGTVGDSGTGTSVGSVQWVLASIPSLNDADVDALRERAQAFLDAVRTLKEAIELARSLRGFMLDVNAEVVGDIASFVRTVVDALRAVDPGLDVEATDAFRRFIDATRGALGALSQASELASDIARLADDVDADLLNERITDLKFVVEHLVFSLGDTAAYIAANRADAFVPALADFVEHVRPAIDLLRASASLLSDLATVPTTLRGIDDRVATLMSVIEAVAHAFTHASALVDTELQSSLSDFSGAMRDAIGAELDALRLVRELIEIESFPTSGELAERWGVVTETVENLLAAIAETTQRLLAAQPDITESLAVFDETFAPVIDALGRVVGVLTAIQATQPLSTAQMRRFVTSLQTFAEGTVDGANVLQPVVDSGAVETIAGVFEHVTGMFTEDRLHGFQAAVEGLADTIRQSASALRGVLTDGSLDVISTTFQQLAAALASAGALGGGAPGVVQPVGSIAQRVMVPVPNISVSVYLDSEPIRNLVKRTVVELLR